MAAVSASTPARYEPSFEPRRLRPVAGMHGDHLEQIAHLGLRVRRLTAAASSGARSGLASVSAAARRPMPSRFSHSPWVTSRVTLTVPTRRRVRQRVEIDVRGQILLARVLQDFRERMAADRLQRFARSEVPCP